MTTELENVLARELHEVADGLRVPPMPGLPADAPTKRPRPWQPLVVAAAVVLIAGVVALLFSRQDDGSPQPAPPAPSRATESVDTTISTAMPTVPFVVDRRLYVDGEQVPGEWWGLQSHWGVWLATRFDGSWWWGGPGVEAQRIEGQFDQPPVLSPNGSYIAYIDVSGGRASVNGFTTEPGGEGFGLSPLDDLPRYEDGVAIRVSAVTDDGDVIVQGTRTSLVWRAQHPAEPTVIDLADAAPDQVLLQATPVGLVVVDGSGGAVDATDTEPHLALIDWDGNFSLGPALPTYDTLDISPGGGWLLRSPAGTLGGEVTAVGSLRAQPVGGGDEMVLDAPDGWGFVPLSWSWEDDETVLATLVGQGRAGPAEFRLVRCRVDLGACRDFPAPEGAGETARDTLGSFTAEATLDAVVRAVVSDDRASLLDPAVVADGEWDQLVAFAAGGGGSASTCRDNGSGNKDCEIDFDAAPEGAPATVYYAILEPADNAYGWRVSYVGIGGA
ncbi:hypothetical protein [Nocardioides sp. T2.26MG-1]|uniref:hypothetical protein n=1 Tax=Nocardioides sp. T2.26MG-1 TaxID=3041166 RepID=UPI0024774EFA|nr:hypothetical protein [Nocardioides sp. T2.26MG-1]CAI9410549.1 hypothetical protein HIDPHFAB_04949 [Nocardioides sp. T2.26MG-1]